MQTVAKARAKNLAVKLLLRCNLLTYFKNFLKLLHPEAMVGEEV